MKKPIQSGPLAVRHAFARRGQFPPSRFLPSPVYCAVLCGLLAFSGAMAQPAAAAEDAKSRQERNDHDNALALARESIDQGNYDKAIELTTLVLQGWPGDPTAKSLLARAHMRKAMGSVAPVSPPKPSAPDIPAPAQPAQTDAVIPPAPGTSDLGIPQIAPPKATRHEISLSGDFFLGEGTISLPFGYSINQALGAVLNPTVTEADRSSLYFGGTISYSFGQAWYFDFSYAMGSSSGDTTILGLDSTFSLDDTWYQGYIRYTFPRLRGRRLSAYLRAGASFVDSTMLWRAPLPGFGLYEQNNDAQDILGNLGAGVLYKIYANRRFSLGIQGEAEGFYGFRSQDSEEDLPDNFGFEPQPVTIDNTLMGGIGRGTIRMEYRLGSSGLFRIYGDVGFQAKFTIIDYPDGGGGQNELLWGPYAKVGVRYSF